MIKLDFVWFKGIFKTTDAGLNWVKVYTPKAIDEEIRAISFKDEKNGMALLGILYNNFSIKQLMEVLHGNLFQIIQIIEQD